MSEFGRTINMPALRALAEKPNEQWWRDLLKAWVPAGHDAGDFGLRLAVRNGTLNFYVKGQSVAQVMAGVRGRISLRTHVKYAGITGHAGDYVNYGHGADRKMCDICQWTARAFGQKGEEKFFVDDVVAQNPEVIDLEMGIPGRSIPPRIDPRTGLPLTPSAPRVDLVALETRDDKTAQVVFWEAKLTSDARLVSKTNPEVLEQLALYRKFLLGNEEKVRAAYVSNCQLLCDLHNLAEDHGNAHPLSPLINSAANGRTTLVVDTMPRLLLKQHGRIIDGDHEKKLKKDYPILKFDNQPYKLYKPKASA